MEFFLLHFWTFFSLALVASHAALPNEVYWNKVLPNTAMPQAVKDLLHPAEWEDDKSTSVSVGKGGVNVNTGKGKSGGGTSVNVGRKGVGVNTGKPRGGTHVSVGGRKGGGGGGGGVRVGAGKPGKGTNVGVGKGGVNVRTGHKGKPVYVGVNPGPNPFAYKYAATENQLHDDPNVALFFLEKDLHPGKKMNLHFFQSSIASSFLPQKVADSIPFSSNKIPEILNKFSVSPDSPEADVMRNTIKECEEPGIRGEDKYCATSLESMVDFTTSKLGKNVNAISTESNGDVPLQEYSFSGVKEMGSDNAVVCHRQNYAYAVFYCHQTHSTKAYSVSLLAADGSKVEAVAVCHEDTSAWNPKHLAFQVLNIKPGSLPICHFLPQDHIVWTPK